MPFESKPVKLQVGPKRIEQHRHQQSPRLVLYLRLYGSDGANIGRNEYSKLKPSSVIVVKARKPTDHVSAATSCFQPPSSLMVFHWSTPERRIGHVQLEPIPVEIYHEIFTYIEPSAEFSEADCRETFSSIAGVCRFFAAEALPRVCHSFHVACHAPGSRNAMKLCRKIKNDRPLASHIATLIRECVLTGWVFDEENQTEQAALAALLNLVRKAIQKMPELETIKLDNCRISNAMMKLVCQAADLRSLHLHQCRPTSLLNDRLWDPLFSARIVDLTVVYSVYESNEIETSAIISHLPFQHLVSVKTNHRGLLDAIAFSSCHLQRLEITNFIYILEDLLHLGDVLKQLPLLTHLSIHRLTNYLPLAFHNVHSMPGNFTGISLPSLRSLLCPGSIAAAFLSPVPGSLVHLDLTGTHVAQSPSSGVQTPWRFPTLDNVYADSLEELTIPMRGLVKGSFPFNCPHPRLRNLAIIGEDLVNAFSCTVLKAVCIATPTANIPPLLEISFASGTDMKWTLDLPSQRDEIQSLTPFFPTLREVRLGECVRWDLAKGSWAPTILQPKKMRLLMTEFPEEFCSNVQRSVEVY
ncbi:hypothetical protein BDZ89DRAFT_1230257 [Hymenopellis radicata]|nr:hypothetical protein BDZ89DRAFT_1230257 [Hymenopellis radicata]